MCLVTSCDKGCCEAGVVGFVSDPSGGRGLNGREFDDCRSVLQNIEMLGTKSVSCLKVLCQFI